MRNPWIMMIRGDDGTWVVVRRFAVRRQADTEAEAYEDKYGNLAIVLGSW